MGNVIENRAVTSEAVIKNNADFGIAWDGDFDRCFLFDEKGQFIDGYYLVGVLAQAFLSKNIETCNTYLYEYIIQISKTKKNICARLAYLI